MCLYKFQNYKIVFKLAASVMERKTCLENKVRFFAKSHETNESELRRGR